MSELDKLLCVHFQVKVYMNTSGEPAWYLKLSDVTIA